MGCLVELFFEIVVEGIIELIGFCYIKLMQLVVPDKTVSDRAKEIIKITVTVIAGLLFIALIVGLLLFMQDDPLTKAVGRYMVWIPLTLIVLQIAVGIIMKLVHLFKKMRGRDGD